MLRNPLLYPIAAAAAVGSYTVKGGGGGSGGGGFSGDHLPVSGACSCRARFSLSFFFPPHTRYMLASMYVLYSQVCKSM